MPTKILMPALSPTMTEGNLARWLKKEGDAISPGDAIAEIETDKATMEVEAVDEGVLGRIVVPEGTEGVKVNAVIGLLLEEGEDPKSLDEAGAGTSEEKPDPKPQAQPEPAAKAEPEPRRARAGNGADTEVQPPGGAEPAATPLARRMAEQSGIALSGLKGSGPRGKVVRADVEAAASRAATAAGPAPRDDKGERIFASPLARRMAKELGLDLAALEGSGPSGRIVRADVEAAQARPRPAPAEAPAPAAARPEARAEASRVVKMSTMRRIIAERMTQSKTTVPHFYLSMDCAIDELLAVRAELNKRRPEVKISVNDFIVRACALALREVPECNVAYEGDGQLRIWDVVDVAVAVALDGGLITPIIRDADSKGLAEISTEMKDLAERARTGKLAPEEYQGGTFSISNLGMFGVRQFDAVINPPQACILAVGAGEQRAVVKDGALAIATMMTCTLSVDHRAVDGALGARLLGAVKRYIDYPPAMLL